MDRSTIHVQYREIGCFNLVVMFSGHSSGNIFGLTWKNYGFLYGFEVGYVGILTRPKIITLMRNGHRTSVRFTNPIVFFTF